MAKATPQQDLEVLSTAKNGLVYLTANDWALIVDKAKRVRFKAGEHCLQRGRRSHGIYILLKGAAAAQIPPPGNSRIIGPGEVCGEVSFLDDQPATADVVANEAFEALYLDRPTLQSLFELFPHLGSRFFHSLATIVAHRLREVIGPAGGDQKS